MSKGEMSPTRRLALMAAVAAMLTKEGWKDGPGYKPEPDPDRLREDRDERDRMEREFDRVWRGDE